MNTNDLYTRLSELQDTVDRVRDSLIALRTQIRAEEEHPFAVAAVEAEVDETAKLAPEEVPADLERVEDAPVEDPPPTALHLKDATRVIVRGGFWEGYQGTLVRLVTTAFGLVFAEMEIEGAEGTVKARAIDVDPYDGP